MKNKALILLAAVFAVSFGRLAFAPKTAAYAGSIDTTVLTDSVLSGKLSTQDWSIDDEITLKSKKIQFGKKAYEDSKLTYRTQLNAATESSTYTIKATLGANEVAGDARFGIYFGSDRLRYVVGDTSTNFAYLQKTSSGYVAGFCSYDASGLKTEHVTPMPLTSVTSGKNEFKFEIIAEYPLKVTVNVNDTQLFSGDSTNDNTNIGGYFGFAVSGNSSEDKYFDGYVSAINVVNDYYDTPENVNINDDFNDNSVDTSVWYVFNDGPYMKGVAEKDGMLCFIDNNRSTVTTRYQYSNFEMTLDIPYVQKVAEYNADGSLRTPACSWFGWFTGLQGNDYTVFRHADSILASYDMYFLSFRGNVDAKGESLGGTSVLFGRKTARATYVLPSEYDLWSVENDDRVMNVVFTCVDGRFTFSIKWDDETEYYRVFSVEYPMLTGYISLVGYGAGQVNNPIKSNFAYDNVKITNRDYNGAVLSGVEKQSNEIIKNNGDFGYADSKNPAQLLKDGTDFDGEVGQSSGCGGNIGSRGLWLGTFAAVTAAALICKRGGKYDE